MDKKMWLLLAVIIIVGLITAIGFYKQTDDLKVLFLALNSLALLTAVYISIVNTVKASEFKSKDLTFMKIENSFDFYDKWDSELLKNARDVAREINKTRGNLSDAQIVSKINSDTELERSIITIFNFWQSMYMSIKSERVDEDILKRGFLEIYPEVWEVYRPYLDDTQGTSPMMYKDLAGFYNLWKQKS